MKVLYLQDFNERLNESKFEILSKFGDEVIWPDINPLRDRGIISNFSEYIHEKYSLVVGFGIGGYFAHYISSIQHCPALIFNVGFFYKSGAEMRPSYRNLSENIENKHFLFSLKDEEIDYKRSIKFLKDLKCENIKMLDLTHQIPLDIFENEFSDFRNKYAYLEEEYKKMMEIRKKEIEELEKMKKDKSSKISEMKVSRKKYPIVNDTNETFRATVTSTPSGTWWQDTPSVDWYNSSESRNPTPSPLQELGQSEQAG